MLLEHDCLVEPDEHFIAKFIHTGFLVSLRRELKKFTLVSPRHPYTKKVFPSSNAIEMEQKKHLMLYYYTIHPFSMAALTIHMVMIFCFVNSYTTPLVYAIITKKRHQVFGVTESSVFDVINVFYIISNFFIGTHNKKTHEIILSKKVITIRYLFTYFLVDLSPLFLIITHVFDISYFVDLILLIRLIRIPTLNSYLNELQDWCNLPNIAMVIVKFLFAYFCLFLWCSFFLENVCKLQKIECAFESDPFSTSYKVVTLLINLVSPGQKLSTNSPEMLLKISFLFFGFILQVWVTVSIYKIYKLITSTHSKRQKVRYECEHSLSTYAVPQSVKKKVLSYIDYMYCCTSSHFDKTYANQCLTSSLQTDILQNFTMKLMINTSFYHLLPQYCVDQIISNLSIQIYLPNDVIISIDNNKINAMYFIFFGVVAVYDRDRNEMYHLEQGSNFGDINVFNDVPRDYTIIAATRCTIYVITKTQMLNCFIGEEDTLAKVKTHLWKKLFERQVMNEMII